MGETDAALIAGAAQLGSTAVNAWSAADMNKKQRKWSEQMYATQRADNKAQWHLQNEYNSPTSQMARLREAGLNPHLVYGKGADNVAAPIANTPAPQWNPKAPQVDLGSGITAYMDARIRDAQYDNLKVQNTVATQEAALKAAQVAGMGITNAKSKLDLEIASELKETSMDFSRESLRKLQADTQFQLDENDRRQLSNDMSLKQGLESILTSRAQRANTEADRQRIYATIANLKSSTELQQLDADLKRQGVNPNDPIYQRVLGRTLNELLDGKSIYEKGKDTMKSWWENLTN